MRAAPPQVVLARNVSFPTLAVLWSVAGFPAYYFDEVGSMGNSQIPSTPEDLVDLPGGLHDHSYIA